MLAVVLAADEKWASCADCNCVDGVSPVARWELKGHVEASTICPRRRITSRDNKWIDLFEHYRAGHLWAAGGIGDQPAIYLQAMRLVQTTLGLL